ncbi:glycoside hydrolase family 15 protein [Halorarius litoreus]|uniref:glycoside hydrolase family 15 protein n=1 Tax=Halorarius litoreus TaxID=2962676 RepID=UPI0020CDD9C7|nr:glycoside hydrolase family 15 protein [Halorarius litoreus]
MRLRTALNDYKRDRGPFPGTAPTVDGSLSGYGDRLVYVNPDGSFRDHSAALSGLYGVDRSRFGIETDDGIRWFDDIDPVRQHYYSDTTLVETEYDAGRFTVHQYDLTLGRAHVTHVELRGEVPDAAKLTAFLTFAPEGRETQVGRLIHEVDDGSVVEVFHRDEHDYVAASTGIDDVRGQVPERFDEILDDEPVKFPRRVPQERYEDTHLSGDVVVSAPLERGGRGATVTFVTQLSDHRETTREQAIADIRNAATTHTTPDALRDIAREQVAVDAPADTPRPDSVTADLRALALLRAPSGARIAGPEHDPFFAGSGGYGYTWFRDDSETASYLLDASDRLGFDVDDELLASAEFYVDTQSDDGSWSHRAWAVDGSLAPGWAHGRVEGRDSVEYQADQTATVVSFLAELVTERPTLLGGATRGEVVSAIEAGVGALDETLEEDGLPARCQNLWENMDGRFVHTAATYLEAYATVAAAPLPDAVCENALDGARAVLNGLDELWTGDHYALRLDGDRRDDRLDSASFALVSAFESYAAADGLSDGHLDRLESHLVATFDALYRQSPEVAGLVRFEGDDWRQGDQAGPKVWSVSTAWGAEAAARAAALFDAHDRATDDMLAWAGELYDLLSPDGPFCSNTGHLAEQVFDDGTLDSATPLGWSHALRLHATALLYDLDALPAVTSPEGPEATPRWTTAEKYGVGTVADHDASEPSKVWFTLTDGALTEVRYPRVDLMNLRTLDFLVVDADETSTYTARTHNESRRDDHADTVEREVEPLADDALLFRQTVTETGKGQGHEWQLTAEYAADPSHDAVLASVQFEAFDDNEYELYAVADTALTSVGDRDRGLRLGTEGAYHLAARDAGTFDANDDTMLVDDDGNPYSIAFAMAAEERFDWATVGVAGSSALRELFADGVKPDPVAETDETNLVMVGRIGTGSSLDTTLGLGFAGDADTAGALGEAEGSLARGYEAVQRGYHASWERWLDDKPLPQSVSTDPELAAQYKSCLMALRAVEDKTYLGAGIASPSVPWGEVVPADRQKGYGYNFVWSRDLYQVFTVLQAVDEHTTAHDALAYIYEYQQDDTGFIPQNTYLHGRTRWGGEQMDNISFPQVMAYQLAEVGIGFEEADYTYENVRRSADYVARNGPATAQERWEEESGFSPSSIAAEIAGLACAGKLALDYDEPGDALAWLGLADDWTDRVEEWTATDTGADQLEPPYYVRITRDGNPEAGTERTLANEGPTLDEREIIDGGFLELPRLGIKSGDDPVVEHSVSVVDETIRVETPHGPAFYRYTGDGYGELEREDRGAPWSIDGAGKGRLWPIFTGERAEYELLRGTTDGPDAPAHLLRTMAGFANSGRMLAEQVWDSESSTEFNWEFGEGTGSATPLAWSMAQFVRLAHGIDAGEPVETPTFVKNRYLDTERPDGPDLWVDTGYEGDHLVVTVRTDGDAVAIKSPSETVYVEPTDGEFVVRVGIEYGENEVVVAAASDTDLEVAGTTVERLTL